MTEQEMCAQKTHELKPLVAVLDFSNVGRKNNIVCRSFNQWTRQYSPGDQEKGHIMFNESVPMSKRDEFIACMLLLFFPGIVLWLPVSILIALSFIRWYILIPSLLVIGFILSIIPVIYVPSICGCYILRLFAHYFSLRLVFFGQNSALKINRQYIFANMPHGVFPVGDMLTLFAFHSFSYCIPRYAVSWALVNPPIVRSVFGAYGAISASRESLKEALAFNNNISINIPGLAGIFDTCAIDSVSRKRIEIVQIMKRRGFIRLALERGRRVSIVPVYVFGNTECFSAMFSGNYYVRWFSRLIRFPITWMYGRWFLPVARRTPIMVALGEPIDIDCTAQSDPPIDLINQYHQKFLDAVTTLYLSARIHYGWQDRDITFK